MDAVAAEPVKQLREDDSDSDEDSNEDSDEEEDEPQADDNTVQGNALLGGLVDYGSDSD